MRLAQLSTLTPRAPSSRLPRDYLNSGAGVRVGANAQVSPIALLDFNTFAVAGALNGWIDSRIAIGMGAVDRH